MPKQIQNPRVADALQRAFGIQGRIQPALDTIVVPTVQIGDLGKGAPPPVAGYAIATLSQAAVAGEQFTARFEVPGNVIAVVEQIHFRFDTSQFIRIGFTTPAAAQANTADKNFIDGRLTQVGLSPAGVLTYGTQVGGISFEALYRVNNTGATIEIPGLVVGSGDSNQFGFLEFQSSGANVSAQMTLVWREYAIV